MDDGLRTEIAEHIRRGEQPDMIEAELLSPRPELDDDERAALWLYAWLEHEGAGGRPGPPRVGAAESIHD